MSTKEEIISLTCGRIKEVLIKLDGYEFDEIQEIRIRVNSPIKIKIKNKKNYVVLNKNFIPTQYELKKVLETASGYSLYAFNQEIKNGFITVKGGHRIGIGGRGIISDGLIIDFREITSLNIRVAHEIIGCGEKLIPYIYPNKEFKNTMIISPPCSGKTTILRDVVRIISNFGENIAVIDERREIMAKENSMGENTDIIDGCPKIYGMKMALRSLSPNIIAVDEIASKEDGHAIWEIACSGVGIICSCHGDSVEDLLNKGELNSFINKKIFKRYVFLHKDSHKIGEIKSVVDESFNKIVV